MNESAFFFLTPIAKEYLTLASNDRLYVLIEEVLLLKHYWKKEGADGRAGRYEDVYLAILDELIRRRAGK